jgi:general secretion pathway protein D
MGYRVTAADNFATLPRGPQDLEAQTHLKKPTQRGQRFLQIGFQSFTSQPHQLWLYGVTRRGKGLAANTDLPLLEKELDKLRANIKATDQPKAFPVAELRSRRLTLSYTSVDRCTKVLRSLGYNVVKPGESKTKTPGMLKPEELPMVMAVPAASGSETSLVGNKQYTVGGSGGNRNIAELKKTVGAPTTQLLVFYNPNQPQQYARLHEVVRNSIDVPARQIMIEAMVLELSETTLEKLGVNWKLQNPLGGELDNISDLQFGKLPNFTGDEEKTFQLNIDGISNHWRAELEALVRDGRARILSRPSVLTLNNRQAFIRVGEDIPIATSVRGSNRSDLISFDFEYIPVGISLNVRPRVSAEDKKISMQINGDVSATVPGEDLIIRDEDGDVAASAPRLSQRRVQTYARVANNTPFIIGGLISEDNTVQTDKVPLLGDIPIAGALFRDKEVNQLKREVIIVLTPYVLPRDQIVGRNLPKDEDAFDSFGNELFRDAYRIRAEDVFDLSFLTENKHLQRMQALADKAINRNYDLRERYPFSQFVDGRIPGERILVYRQMYEVIKRKGLADELSLGKIIFFEANPRAPSNFSVAFLKPWLRDLVKNRGLGELEPEQSPMAVISDSGKAVALTYKDRGQSQKAGDILSQPVPEVELIDCPSDAAWSEKLWSLNQPTEAGQKRYTIILRNESDLMRLKRAVVLKRTVQLNGQRKSLTLDNFSVGRQLLLPEVNPEKVRLVDADVANYFFLTEQYYPALQKQLRQASEALRRSLRKLNVRLPESSP